MDVLVRQRLVDLDPDLALLCAEVGVVHDGMRKNSRQEPRRVEELRHRVRSEVVLEAVEVKDRDGGEGDGGETGRAHALSGQDLIAEHQKGERGELTSPAAVRTDLCPATPTT